MRVLPTAIPDVKLVEPATWRDSRGYFFESFRSDRYGAAGITGPFVQDNQSFSRRGVLRGLHYQWPDNVQGKLVSVALGAVWDVAVDIRRGSPTFGKWVAAELSSDNHHQLWIPPGFAHGFAVLSEEALVTYKCTAFYSPHDEVSIRWNDPSLDVHWPLSQPLVSDKDARAPLLSALPPDCIPQYAYHTNRF